MRLWIVAAIVCAGAPAFADRPTARALMEEGDLHAKAGDVDGALDRYQQAIDADPDMLAVYEKAIPLWIDGRRWQDAAKYLERATARDPSFAHGWYALGYVYRLESRWSAAIAAYEEAVALEAGDAPPWFGLGASYEGTGSRTEAVRAYREYRAREHDPAHAATRAQARASIEKLLGPPADWRDAAIRLALDGDGGDRGAWTLAARLAK